jgi:hypothetical protein
MFLLGLAAVVPIVFSGLAVPGEISDGRKDWRQSWGMSLEYCADDVGDCYLLRISNRGEDVLLGANIVLAFMDGSGRRRYSGLLPSSRSEPLRLQPGETTRIRLCLEDLEFTDESGPQTSSRELLCRCRRDRPWIGEAA